MIAHYLLNPDQRHSMDTLAETLMRYKPLPIESLIGKRKNQKTFDQLDLEVQKEYAVEDADITLRLKHILEPQLPAVKADKLLKEIEMPLMGVLTEMEVEGIRVDAEVLKEQSEKYLKKFNRLKRKFMNILVKNSI